MEYETDYETDQFTDYEQEAQYEQTMAMLEYKEDTIIRLREWVTIQETKGNILPEIAKVLLTQTTKEYEELIEQANLRY